MRWIDLATAEIGDIILHAERNGIHQGLVVAKYKYSVAIRYDDNVSFVVSVLQEWLDRKPNQIELIRNGPEMEKELLASKIRLGGMIWN